MIQSKTYYHVRLHNVTLDWLDVLEKAIAVASKEHAEVYAVNSTSGRTVRVY